MRQLLTEELGRAECIHETDRALLFELDGEEVWIPKSVVVDADEWSPGVTWNLEVHFWFAAREGLCELSERRKDRDCGD